MTIIGFVYNDDYEFFSVIKSFAMSMKQKNRKILDGHNNLDSCYFIDTKLIETINL